MAETPINTRVFNVRPLGIYRYTDEKHIQREGKGEGKSTVLTVTHKKDPATASVYGISVADGDSV